MKRRISVGAGQLGLDFGPSAALPIPVLVSGDIGLGSIVKIDDGLESRWTGKQGVVVNPHITGKGQEGMIGVFFL